MISKIIAFFQYVIPQHLISTLVGKLADVKTPWIKNRFIRWFIKHYKIDMREAAVETPEAYSTFNQFFTRQLKPGLRTIANGINEIACPVDGCIAQLGSVRQGQLLQAKNMYFDLKGLLGGDQQLAKTFHDGLFATLYLAPHNYHRVHMPVAGKLVKTIYVPGKLFSVNRITSELIPNLYSRNERLICIFDTAMGQMAIILVGALIVGSIQTVWMNQPVRSNQIVFEHVSDHIQLEKGAEMGCFKLGSTVIVLFPKDSMQWAASMHTHSLTQYGEILGKMN